MVRFSPSRENATSSAQLVIASDAVDSPLTVTLTGTSTGLPEGPKGDTGEKGEKGDTGDAGPTGPVGPTGPQGSPGAIGPKGDTGATGAPGAKGDTGAKGEAGSKGDTGAQGPAGSRGATGPAGKNGKDGVVSFTTSGGDADARRGGTAHLQFKLKNGTVGALSGARLKAGSLSGNGTTTVKISTLKAHETRKLTLGLKGRQAHLARPPQGEGRALGRRPHADPDGDRRRLPLDGYSTGGGVGVAGAAAVRGGCCSGHCGRPRSVPGVSWRPGQAVAATRRPGRQGGSGKDRVRNVRHGSSCVPAPFAGTRAMPFVICPSIGGQMTNGMPGRLKKTGGTVTFHGSSWRTCDARAIRGVFVSRPGRHPGARHRSSTPHGPGRLDHATACPGRGRDGRVPDPRAPASSGGSLASGRCPRGRRGSPASPGVVLAPPRTPA